MILNNKMYQNRYLITLFSYKHTILLVRVLSCAILSYYTYILDITMTVGIFRIPYKCHEI